MWEAFLNFSTKNIGVFGYKDMKHLTSWTLNELIHLTMLLMTGPWKLDAKFMLPPLTPDKYRKNSKIWDTSNNCHNCPKNRKVWCNIALMHPKDADGMANRVDPDQTASSEAVWSWSALFAETYLSQYIEFVRYYLCLVSSMNNKTKNCKNKHIWVQNIY